MLERRYDDALANCRKVIETSPDARFVYVLMANIYMRNRLFTEARKMLERAGPLDSQRKSRSIQAQIYALMGEREKALDVVHQLEETLRNTYVPATDIA